MGKAIDIIRETNLRLGLELNTFITEIYWSSCDGSKLFGVWFPSAITVSVLEMKLL